MYKRVEAELLTQILPNCISPKEPMCFRIQQSGHLPSLLLPSVPTKGHSGLACMGKPVSGQHYISHGSGLGLSLEASPYLS